VQSACVAEMGTDPKFGYIFGFGFEFSGKPGSGFGMVYNCI